MDNSATQASTPDPMVSPSAQQPTVQSQPNTPNQPMKKSPLGMILVCGCLLLFVLVVVVGAVLAMTNTDVKAFIASIIHVGKYQEANSTAELNKYIQDAYSDVVRSVDLSKFNKTNPIDILTKDKLIKLSREDEKLNKLANYNFNPSGKTVQVAFDGTYNINVQGSTANFPTSDLYPTPTPVLPKSVNAKFTSDLYVTYANYDYSKFSNKDLKAYTQFLNSLTVEEVDKFMPKFDIIGNVDLTQGTEHVKANFDITYADKAIYVKFSDVQVPDSLKNDTSVKQLLLTEGKVMKINIQKQYDTFVQAYLDEIHKSLKVYNSWDDVLKDLNDKLKESFKDMKDSDVQMIDRVGNPVRDIIADTIANVNVFSNITNVDPIRSNADAVCSQGNLDLNSILDNAGSAAKKIYNVVKNDPGYTGEKDDQKVTTGIDQSISTAKKSISDNNIAVKITTCTSKAQNYFTGLGISASGTMKSPYAGDTSMTMSFNTLIADWNSSKAVVAPKADVDITDQVMPSTLTYPATPGLGTRELLTPNTSSPQYGYPGIGGSNSSVTGPINY